MKKKWFYLAPLAIVALLLFIAAGGEIVKLLWNWLLPPLLALPQITFWKGLGVLALCRILFGGFGKGGSYRSKFRRRMEERWQDMTPEEKERFRQGMRRRCGFGPPAGESTGETK